MNLKKVVCRIAIFLGLVLGCMTASFVHAESLNQVFVKTDVLSVTIDSKGRVVDVKLPEYKETQKSEKPFELMGKAGDHYYLAERGLSSQDDLVFQHLKTHYTLRPGQTELRVPLTYQDPQTGHSIQRVYTFKRGRYTIGVSDELKAGNTPWSSQWYMQLSRTMPAKKDGAVSRMTYLGAAVSIEGEKYKKVSFKDMVKKPLSKESQGGWIAMLQHYFVSAWVPEKSQNNYFYSHVGGDGHYTVGVLGPKWTLSPNESKHFDSTLYAGPEVSERLKAVAPGLELTVDYGHLWIISSAIFWLMKHIYQLVGNWGWSILLVTACIKLLFYRLSAKSFRSMARLKEIQPRLQQLKERFGDNKQAFSQAMMDLYRREKVNPLGGCLPILVQIPVFFGLYWVLIESVELRHAPFIFWIQDLSSKDPLYVLPVLMGASMFLQQKMSPSALDPTQAKMMLFLPVIFTALFMNMPSGLVLYWLVNNLLSVAQQYWIQKTHKHPKHKKKKRG